jgi:UTP--glucose-1-phosphate uridylyltransferase
MPAPTAARAGAARKAVIPANGMGTRLLPATKAVPKELLPVVDRPALQYVVEEASRAGLGEVLLVTGRGKAAIEDHFDRRPDLERVLEEKGDADRLAAVRASDELAHVHVVRQGEALGMGHAVLQAATFVGDEPFAVLLGDDIVDARDHLLEQMLAVQHEHGGSVVALLEVGPEHIHRYGVAAVEPVGDAPTDGDRVVRVTGLVEKPRAADAPSRLALIGRYVLAPEIFGVLRATGPGRDGEIQLTDALAALVARGEPVHGVVFSGRRYDTGNKVDYLKAVVALAVERDDVGPPLRSWLRELVADLPAEGASPS